jgi:hypothetical protein
MTRFLDIRQEAISLRRDAAARWLADHDRLWAKQHKRKVRRRRRGKTQLSE